MATSKGAQTNQPKNDLGGFPKLVIISNPKGLGVSLNSLILGSSQNEGYLTGGPHNKDYSFLGSIFGSPYFGKLPDPLLL